MGHLLARIATIKEGTSDKGTSNYLTRQRRNHTSKVGSDTSQKPPSCPSTVKKLGKTVELLKFPRFSSTFMTIRSVRPKIPGRTHKKGRRI